MNKEIKKGNLNYDQSGRAYPDNPQIKENWDCIWENNGKHYRIVGDDEHKEWEIYLGEMINVWIEPDFDNNYYDVTPTKVISLTYNNKTIQTYNDGRTK